MLCVPTPLTGANHFTFSDQILLKSQHLIHALQLAGPFGHLAPQRGLAITTTYVHTFFDVYLKSAPASQLTNLLSQFPEARPEPLTPRAIRIAFG